MATIKLGNLYHESTTLPNSETNPVNTKDVNLVTELTAVKNELTLVKTELQTIKTNQTSGNQKVQLPGSENFAKDLTIQEVTSELELVKAELQTIKANQLSGDQKVQLSGTIKSTKVYRSPSSTIPAGVTETLLEITGEVIVHDVIFYFREGVGDPGMRVSFFDGLSWSEYNRFNASYGEWSSRIRPSNVLVDPLFKLLVENENVVTLRNPGLRIKGIRIERRNLSAQEDGNVGVNVIYSEV